MNFSEKNINKAFKNKRVLVAPLDWGLGHTTRCIPVIRELLSQGFEVFIGAEKAGTVLLQNEFPQLNVLTLKGYRITYSKKKIFFFLKMAIQLPKLFSIIKQERSWLARIVKKYSIDIVISDNRYGLYHKNAHCIFITHQLFIKTGNWFTEKIGQKINYGYINRFDTCWVPDISGKNNLAGNLSHPLEQPKIPVQYIGLLSRFGMLAGKESEYILIMLSGPEPQRTIFENVLLPQIKSSDLKIVMVRGLPSAHANKQILNNDVILIDHLPGPELNELIRCAKVVIARSGYTTVMELAALQKTSILVPTPGQTEQEYLAEYLSGRNYCIAVCQDGFNLQSSLKSLHSHPIAGFPLQENNELEKAVSALL